MDGESDPVKPDELYISGETESKQGKRWEAERISLGQGEEVI